MIAFRKQGRPLFLALAVVILLSALIGWRSLERYQSLFGMYHDDGVYLVTAKAIAEGKGYKIISLPGDPPETKYPIGYPLYLSFLWKLFPHFPQNLPIMSALQMVLSLLADIITVVYLRRTRRVTPLLASVILTACLLNYHYLDFAPMLMSDMPYALAAVLALWATERLVRAGGKGRKTGGAGGSELAWERRLPAGTDEEPPSKAVRQPNGRSVSAGKLPALPGVKSLVGLLLTAAVLIRSQGLIIVFSCLFYIFRRAGWRSAAGVALLPALSLGVQYAWQAAARQSVPPFLSFYSTYLGHAYGTLPDSRALWEAFLSAFYWGWRLAVNTHVPFLQEVPYATLPPLLFELLYRVIYPVLAVPLFIGVIRGARRGQLPGIYCLLYGFSLLFWPLRLEWRHMFVGTPLTYYFYFQGLRIISRRMKPRSARARAIFRSGAAAASIAVCLFLTLGTAAEALLTDEQFSRLIAMPTMQFDQSVLDRDYQEAYSWIRARTPETSVFISNNDPRFFLFTRRKAVLPSQLEMWRFVKMQLVDTDSLVEAIRFAHAGFIITEPTFRSTGMASEQTERALSILARQCPGLLSPVFESSAGLIHIFAIDADKLPRQ